MVPPPLPAADLGDNEKLLDRLLDSDGGISEFIIPLVYNGHLTEGVRWVKPVWSDQIACGEYVFEVGEAAGLLGVSAALPYYLDDGLAFAPEELSGARPVRLLVLEAAPQAGPPEPAPYILDICLDYFHTRNPFLAPLQDAFEAHAPGSGPSLVGHYSRLFAALRHRSLEGAALSPRERRIMRARFLRLLELCVFSRAEGLADCCAAPPEGPAAVSARAALLSHTCAGAAGAGAAVDALLGFCEQLRCAERLDPDGVLARRRCLLEVGVLCLLPDSGPRPRAAPEVDAAVDCMVRYLQSAHGFPDRLPVAVCVARSDGDAYTPPELVERIQARVLHALQEALGVDAAGRRLRVYDIRGDPVALSRRAFLEDAALFRADVGRRRAAEDAGGGEEIRAARKRRLLAASGFAPGEEALAADRG